MHKDNGAPKLRHRQCCRQFGKVRSIFLGTFISRLRVKTGTAEWRRAVHMIAQSGGINPERHPTHGAMFELQGQKEIHLLMDNNHRT